MWERRQVQEVLRARRATPAGWRAQAQLHPGRGRASNVAFLELDWTPARHDQAEDRCHRIDQRDAVTAYYLLAPDTIDVHMAGVLHRKRGIIGAVTDGRDPATNTALDEVVRALRGVGTVAEMQAA